VEGALERQRRVQSRGDCSGREWGFGGGGSGGGWFVGSRCGVGVVLVWRGVRGDACQGQG